MPLTLPGPALAMRLAASAAHSATPATLPGSSPAGLLLAVLALGAHRLPKGLMPCWTANKTLRLSALAPQALPTCRLALLSHAAVVQMEPSAVLTAVSTSLHQHRHLGCQHALLAAGVHQPLRLAMAG